MSVKLMGEVYDLDLPHDEAWVLMAFADHADHEGECFPGIPLIAWKTRYSIRQVRYITAKLIAKEILEVVTTGGGRGKLTVYQLHLDRAPRKPPITEKGDRVAGFTETLQSGPGNPAKTLHGDAETCQSQARNVQEPLTVNQLTDTDNREDEEDVLREFRPLADHILKTACLPQPWHARWTLKDNVLTLALSNPGAYQMACKNMPLWNRLGRAASETLGRGVRTRLEWDYKYS